MTQMTEMSAPIRRQLNTDLSVRRYEDVGDLLAGPQNPTPLVRLTRAAPPVGELYLKLEWMNPYGSIKDRTAAYLLAGLIERGELDGARLVEATSGNTGIALAALTAPLGIELVVTVPDGIPEESKTLMRMLGADVWETPDDLCPVDHPKDGAIALARSLVGSATGTRHVMADQYENPDNVTAHYETTGPEIWAQTEGRVDWFVAGLGTGGTISGVGRYLKERNPDVRVIGIEPQPGHRLPGLKSFEEARVPGILDRSVIDEIVRVDDDPAYEATRRLYRKEGLIVGPSTGAVLHAAHLIPAGDDDVIVGVSPDSGLKYMSYFAEQLGDEGLPT